MATALAHGTVLSTVVALALLLCGCAERRDAVIARAEAHGMQPFLADVPPFRIKGWERYAAGGDRPLVVYIEGDGYAFRTRSEPSSDPTPIHPVGLSMAADDHGASVIYLGRPCQYVRDIPACSTRYWTTARFAPEIIGAMDQAIYQAVERHGTGPVILVGYSGGGVVAALIAARREDVTLLVTVAAPLDLDAWTQMHGISPLTGSLRPLDVVNRLAAIPQRHYVGERDKVVPPAVVESFMAVQAARCVELQRLADCSHDCGWNGRIRTEPLRCP